MCAASCAHPKGQGPRGACGVPSFVQDTGCAGVAYWGIHNGIAHFAQRDMQQRAQLESPRCNPCLNWSVGWSQWATGRLDDWATGSPFLSHQHDDHDTTRPPHPYASAGGLQISSTTSPVQVQVQGPVLQAPERCGKDRRCTARTMARERTRRGPILFTNISSRASAAIDSEFHLGTLSAVVAQQTVDVCSPV